MILRNIGSAGFSLDSMWITEMEILEVEGMVEEH